MSTDAIILVIVNEDKFHNIKTMVLKSSEKCFQEVLSIVTEMDEASRGMFDSSGVGWNPRPDLVLRIAKAHRALYEWRVRNQGGVYYIGLGECVEMSGNARIVHLDMEGYGRRYAPQ